MGSALRRSLRGDIEPGQILKRAPVTSGFRRLTWITAGLAFVLGAGALGGVLWDYGGTPRALPAMPPMHPLTAAGLMMCSLTVVLLIFGREAAAKGVALVSAAIGMAGLLQLASVGWAGFVHPLIEPLAEYEGRLAHAAALSFILFSIAALGLTSSRSARRTIAVTSGTAGLALALLSLLGHALLSGRRISQIDAALIMPFSTAVALAAVFGALLLVRPHASWVGILMSDDNRGRTARILLLSALIPAPLGWLADRGYQGGLYGTDARLLLIVLGAVLLLTMLALVAAVMIGDERRDRLEIARALDLSPNLLQDETGRIVYWSRGCENLYGWTAEEAEGKPCSELLGECAPDFGRSDTLLLDNDAWQGELRHRTRDGRERRVSARWVLYRGGEGRPPLTLISFNDVTRERQAQAALQERDANLLQLQAELIEVSRLSSMGEMAAALAHELNQPLTAAANFLGAVEMVLGSAGSTANPVAQKHVATAVVRAKEEALRAGEIVRRLREFIARGDADMQRESLPDIIENAVLLGLASLEQKTIDLEYALSPEAEYVLADRVQIQQVIVNIVRNAAEAMARTGDGPRRITISSRTTADRYAEVIISDTGPGISDEMAATLFTPFTSSKVTGMGVGLSICKRIVETHGGDIWARRANGGGAEFHFTLPLFDRAEDEE